MRRCVGAGAITAIAGGPSTGFEDGVGTKALFNLPEALLCTTDGSKIYVADQGNDRIRCVYTATRCR